MPHETTLDAARHALQFFNHAVDRGLANSDILSLTTVAGLKVAITAKVVHEVDVNMLRQANKAIDTAQAIGVLTDTNVAAADTVAGIRSLFTTFNSALTSTDSRTFQYT